jgi:Fe-S cluster assembly iron-binding protein IscA
MLAVTDNAATAIRDITAAQEVPPGAGLRIAADDASTGALTLSVVAEPAIGDQVVDASGARVFLDSQAAELLDDKELDAGVDASGAVQFAVAEQYE